MAAGRPAKSDEQKQLAGTFRQDRTQAVQSGRQPVSLLAEIPDPPAQFDNNLRAQYQWRFVCEELFNLGMLRPIMLDWIELYCLYLSDAFRFREMAEAEEWVTQFQDEEGNVKGEALSKYVQLADSAFAKAQQTMKMLCLDPATVLKLSPKVPDKPKSKMAQLMSRK
ncbi:P27 family phage terminase small subunit [Spirosoma endbachense]|uniref:Phage terminase small subunit P27 family n=1 Tax=Spirosoma endbachense TaxID=2666025 RepID=A0A6P1VSS0_9BACT|nr:P27 family phage terminase small subunit [Spirosoma endbachense]QHV96281.1 hypothetical protein GJR95_15210 [Spirosoma endbachense]